MATATSNSIANEAINLIGDNQPSVTGYAPTFDSSAAGKALQQLYAPTVAAVARQHEWDFARTNAALSLTGNLAPFPWAFEYAYPAQCVQIWQLAPASLTDPNDPLPVNWIAGNSSQGRVVWTNLAGALAIYNANPPEAIWDALFRESVVRLLASGLAMALAGKPDVAKDLLESGGAFSQMAESRDG